MTVPRIAKFHKRFLMHSSVSAIFSDIYLRIFEKHEFAPIMLYLILFLTILLVAVALDRFVFSESEHFPSGKIISGMELNSKVEGFRQRILEIADGKALVALKIDAHAEGPPKHFHATFDETFTVKSGKLSVLIHNEKKVLSAGETVLIPKGTPHKLFNECDLEVELEPGYMPVLFLAHLSQLYTTMDELGTMKSPKIMFRLAASGNNFDTWIADGPPIGVQKAMRVLLAPWARLLGYKRW
jgi:mannose-6-phosphate isomerase-like protein (cupin superfamily)